MSGYRVEWTGRAKKSLKDLDRRQAQALFMWVKNNLDGCENPRIVGDGKKLAGTERGWRWRVGSYRIIATIKDEELVIDVVRVGHRQGVYGNLPKKM